MQVDLTPLVRHGADIRITSKESSHDRAVA
jgi:hypothetical protein